MTTSKMDRNDVEAAAHRMAGNGQRFDSFVWSRGYGLPDADHWLIVYTCHRDAGLLAQSNAQVLAERLAPFSVGDDPDLVFERHTHFAFGYADGLSIGVFRADGTSPLRSASFAASRNRLTTIRSSMNRTTTDEFTRRRWRTTAARWGD